ncbi:MAG TPA: class I SAM-dependent methyltransferase [Gaiellaceae bacterium]|jgi:ubiquinone/menaquinone biosynthesis C-methylase UbiE
MNSLNDREAVRREYADESRYAARMAKQETATGMDPYDAVFAAVAEWEPRDVVEVGCGRGELAERILRELSAHVVALDQSERMVELTAARGVEALVGDVVSLPFGDETFDCALAAWMLYHASDLDRALAELRRVLRPDARLVAATSSERNLAEVWELVGEIGAPGGGFTVESAEAALRRHFKDVEQRDVFGTVTFHDRQAAYEYLAATTQTEAADLLPDFDGPLVASRHVAVFVCAP